MTRKSYASIKSAQEAMRTIEELSTAGTADALTKIHALAEKWNKDFSDVDPGWSPAPKQAEAPNLQNRAVALGAFVQTA